MFTIIIIFVRYFHHVGTKVCCAATGMIWDPLPRVILRVHDSGEPVFLVRWTDDAIVNNFFPLTVGGDDETTTKTDGREFIPLTTGAHLALLPRVVFINLTPLPLTHYILYSLLVCAGTIVFFQFRTFIIYVYVYKTRNNEKRPTPVLSSR